MVVASRLSNLEKPCDFGLDCRDSLLYRFVPFDDFRAEVERDGES